MSDELPSAGALVRRFGEARKSLGQCFLFDPSILEGLVAAAKIAPGGPVVEVGPGPGGLTRTLLAAGHRVLAFDLDPRAIAHLSENLGTSALEARHADATTVSERELETFRNGEPLTVAGNLPYNVATKIFFHFESMESVSRMLFMFQQEVAERFVAEVGGGAYGPLAINGRIRWSPRVVVRLPPGAFRPRPKVHSAALRFDRLPSPAVEPELEERFRGLVRSAFQKRRKTVRNALKGIVDEGHFDTAGVDPRLRPERLDFDAFLALARAVGP